MFSKLFGKSGGQSPEQPRNHADPILGTVKLEDEAWEAQIMVAGRKITFNVGSGEQPDPVLIREAGGMAQSFDSFQHRIGEFLESCAQKAEGSGDPTGALAAKEMRQLRIGAISLHSPRNGMIYFEGPNDNLRSWRCDYNEGEPASLGFDS